MNYRRNMIRKTQTPQEKSIPMPITREAQQIARQFANEQPTQQKAEQVYLNTLAVCSVNNYLRIMDIPTDLTAGDSWNPVVRLVADVADLWVTGAGRLECRPVRAIAPDAKLNKRRFPLIKSKPKSNAESAFYCYIPAEVQSDRIGYVVVEIDSQQQEALLLGFSQTAETGELVINQLQSINDMIKQLSVTPVNLSQWLQDIFEEGWQSVESLLDAQKINYAFRRRAANSIRRAKPIHLGTQLDTPNIALAVTLTRETTGNIISLQLLPIGCETYIPAGLKLAVLDEAGETFLEASSGSSDNLIQTRQFGGRSGERFRVQISLDEDSITEDFAI